MLRRYCAGICILALFLVFACSPEKDTSINFDKNNPVLEKKATYFLDSLNHASPLFLVLFNSLNNSSYTLTISLDTSIKIASYKPGKSGNDTIYFKSISEFLDKNILIEELFHVFLLSNISFPIEIRNRKVVFVVLFL